MCALCLARRFLLTSPCQILIPTRNEFKPVFVQTDGGVQPALTGWTIKVVADREENGIITRHTLVGTSDRRRRYRLIAHTIHPLSLPASTTDSAITLHRPTWRLRLPPPTTQHFSRTLRIASYNIWNVMQQKDGVPYMNRIERVRNILGSRHFDVVGLQEVRFDSELNRLPLGPNQVDHLRRHPTLRTLQVRTFFCLFAHFSAVQCSICTPY